VRYRTKEIDNLPRAATANLEPVLKVTIEIGKQNWKGFWKTQWIAKLESQSRKSKANKESSQAPHL
jgi:hypothetical protein